MRCLPALVSVLAVATGCAHADLTTSGAPGSQTATAQEIPLGDQDPFALAVTPDGTLWAVSHNGAAVIRIPATGMPEVTAHIKGGGTALVSAGGALWAVGWPKALYRIDPAGGLVTQTVPLKGADQLAVSDEGLWVSRWQTNTVSLVDPTSGKVVRTLEAGPKVRGDAEGVSGVAFGDGSVWAVRGDQALAYRLDPATGKVEATVKVGDAAGPSTATDGAVWITNLNSDTVTRIDTATNRATDVETGVRPGLALADGSRVWVSNTSDDRLTRIDAASGDAATVKTCYGPYGMVRLHSQIMVACRYKHSIARIAA